MKDLLELKEKTEKEISDLYQLLQNTNSTCDNYYNINKRYLDKIDFLKLIEIVYQIK